MKEINGTTFVTTSEIQLSFDFDVTKAIDENWRLERYYYVHGMAKVVLFQSERALSSRVFLSYEPLHMFEGMIQQNPSLDAEFFEDGDIKIFRGFKTTLDLEVDGQRGGVGKLFFLDIPPGIDGVTEDLDLWCRDYGVAFASEQEFLDVVQSERDYWTKELVPIIYFNADQITAMFTDYGVLDREISALIKSRLELANFDKDPEVSELPDSSQVGLQEPPPHGRKNYDRLIRVLADMAKLDISEPYKAASVVLAHAQSKDGFPHPSDHKTWGDRLKAARDTD